MGRRGPAPAPTAVKLARGETRPSRVNRREPRVPPGPLAVPEGLDPWAAKVWQRVVRVMPKGVITEADVDLLRCYAEAVSRYVQASSMLVSQGPVMRGQHGESVANPLHRIVRDNNDAARLLARELGLSPAARSGLQMDMTPRGDEELEAVLGPGRLHVVGGNG